MKLQPPARSRIRHAGERRHPGTEGGWIPAFAGMTEAYANSLPRSYLRMYFLRRAKGRTLRRVAESKINCKERIALKVRSRANGDSLLFCVLCALCGQIIR